MGLSARDVDHMTLRQLQRAEALVEALAWVDEQARLDAIADRAIAEAGRRHGGRVR